MSQMHADELRFFNESMHNLGMKIFAACPPPTIDEAASEFYAGYDAKLGPDTRAEEERWFRAPLEHERPCRSDQDCAGLRLTSATPIMLVEVSSRDTLKAYAKTGAWPSERAHCVLCRREQMFYDEIMRATYPPLGSFRTWTEGSDESGDPDEDDEGVLTERFEELFSEQAAPSEEGA
jgi:hypothetical protein